MKLRSVLPFVAGLVILQSCATPKNDVLWVGGIKTECDSEAGITECLNVFKGEDLKDEKWENMSANIQGFEYEEGFMKKIEVKKADEESTNADVKYTFVKELEKKADPRIQLKGNWVLATINGVNINKMIVLPTLKFDLSEMRISGNGGCNLYSTSIEELTSKKIELKESAATLMACANENIEDDYHKALAEIKTYEVKGEVLSLNGKDGKTILTYIKVDVSKANQALSGEWMNTRIEGKDIVVKEDTPYITFDLEKMMVAGKDGCNSFNGTISNLSNTDLLLGPIAATKMMCQEMEVPDQFLLAINKVAAYKVKNSELILLDAEGNEVLAFSK